jgi:glycosyltransferase involved in cell wall biosynthesis
MAAKTPIIVPDNTALTEAIADDKGYLVKSGSDPSHFTVLPHDNEVVRPLVDVNDMVEKMLEVYNNYDKAMEKAENAYEWVTTELAWGAEGKIVQRWVEVFDKMYDAHVNEEVGETEEIDVENEIEAEQF